MYISIDYLFDCFITHVYIYVKILGRKHMYI